VFCLVQRPRPKDEDDSWGLQVEDRIGVFCSEKPAPGFQPGSSDRSIVLPRFPGPTCRWLIFALVALSLPLSAPGQSTAHPSAAQVDYGKLPLSFEANQGQSDPQVRFLSHGSGYSLYLTDHAAVLALTKAAKKEHMHGRVAPAELRKGDLLRMDLVQPSNRTQPTGTEQLPGRANYDIKSIRVPCSHSELQATPCEAPASGQPMRRDARAAKLRRKRPQQERQRQR
jgi:hypothetical protein